MTQDVIALTPQMPDARGVLAGLYAGGPDLRVSSSAEGAVVQLHTGDGRPVVTVDVPLFVQVPGEVSRLLGTGVETGSPVWWTEVRATTSIAEAGRLAGSVAGRLASLLGGSTWPADAAHTSVVPVPSPDDDSPAGGPVAVDVLTTRAAVILQDRPVVAATTWLTDLIQSTVQSGHELQIVTPPGTRLTLPTRGLLAKVPARWVVQDPQCGYYDGLTGAVLHWDEDRFTEATPADGRTPLADAFQTGALARGEQQLHLSIRAIHPATDDLLLGGALEAAWQTLTGAPPAGWSTAEPVNLPWSPRQLTELARARAQKGASTWLVAVGAPDRPAIATCRVIHTPAGIEEHLTLALGCTTDTIAPLDVLPELAETLATRHNLTSMLTHLRPARTDLTTPPHHEPPPVPVSFTLGPDAVRTIGRAHAESLEDPRPMRLGSAVCPTLHYALGDGSDAAAWHRLQDLNSRLKARQ
ncbi:DUF6177 family protein [Streptomyces lavendofoliae]|uniref:Uncharacterized protein n=1 Tax=Streptomyces lavendofoliae TaxID=67314 RepID=A0A918M3U8_9ACTN|nr:DUF6177 family protein [Streptomyces lavendofoliae]GGU29414.1 hypothetical protein GCM10010274_15380 [Streptomyces lavendofoliae]